VQPDTSSDSPARRGADIRTFLFADVRGYTRYTREHGDEAASLLAAKLAEVVREVVPEFHGDLFELRGDEAVSVFFSAREAIRAAVELQRRLREERDGDARFPLGVGMGIDSGEAVPTEGGFRGGALNLAARLCAIAKPGQILASDHCAHLAGRVEGARLVDRRPVRLKGLERPVRSVEVVPEVPLAPLPRLPKERRPGRLAAAVIALAVVALAAIIAGVLSGSQPSPEAQSIPAGAMAVVNANGRAARWTLLRDRPTAVAFGAGSIWTVTTGGTLWRIQSDSGVAAPYPVGAYPSGVAFGGGSVWVTNSSDGTVSRIDPATGHPKTIPVGNGPTGVVYGFRRVWVADTIDDSVAEINPNTERVRRISAGQDPTQVAIGAGKVWVTNESAGTVTPISPGGAAETPIAVGQGPDAIAASGDAVWVANSLDGTVFRIDPRAGKVARAVTVGSDPTAIALVGGTPWVAVRGGDRLVRLDPSGRSVTAVVPTGSSPQVLSSTPGGLVLGTVATPTVHRGGTLIGSSPPPPGGSSFQPSIDPDSGAAWSYVSWQILAMTNDGLVGYKRVGGPDGETVVADLAQALPAIGHDGLTYTFTLRPGIHYSNRKPVRASDIRRGLERFLRLNPPAHGVSPYEVLFYRHIDGAMECNRRPKACDLTRGIVVNDRTRTVTFHLTTPDPDFLPKLALPFADAIPPGAPMRDLGATPLPSTGPYQVRRYQYSARKHSALAVLTRNPRFRVWSTDAQPPGYPDRIMWKTLPTAADEFRAIAHGRSDDWTFNFAPPALVPTLQDRYAAQLHPSTWAITSWIALTPTVPPFSSPKARLAVAYAINRRHMAHLDGAPLSARVTCQILPPGFTGYEPYCPTTKNPNRFGTWLAPNTALAERLVAESGTRGDTVVMPQPDSPRDHYLAKLLRSLGYHTHFTPDEQRYAQRWTAQISGLNADYPAPDDFIGFVCQPGYCPPSIDRGIQHTLAVQLHDPGAAAALWARLDRQITKAGPPFVPYDTVLDTGFTSKRVGNYQFSPATGDSPLIDQMWVK